MVVTAYNGTTRPTWNGLVINHAGQAKMLNVLNSYKRIFRLEVDPHAFPIWIVQTRTFTGHLTHIAG
jgi:hypothetical protein